MLPQRQMFRLAPRFATQLRSPAVRSALQRRLASTAGKSGDNAFIREREAVKAHAAGSTGESFWGGGKPPALGRGAWLNYLGRIEWLYMLTREFCRALAQDLHLV